MFFTVLGGPLSYSGLTDIDWRTNGDGANTSNTSIDTGINSPSHETCNDSSLDAAAVMQPESHHQSSNLESIASAPPEVKSSTTIADDPEEMLLDFNVDIESLYKFVEWMTDEAPKTTASPADDSFSVAMQTISEPQDKNISVIVEDEKNAVLNEIDQQVELNAKQQDDVSLAENSQADTQPDVVQVRATDSSVATSTASAMKTRRISRIKVENVAVEAANKDQSANSDATVPTKEKTFMCKHPGCNRRFRRKNHLSQHSRVHIVEGSYACEHPGCNQSFNVKAHLRRHKRVHVDEKPFICGYLDCNKAFRSKTNLILHGRVHGEGKP